jgi:hypothetical protein
MRSFAGNFGRGIDVSDAALIATANTITGDATGLPAGFGYGIIAGDFIGPAPPTVVMRRNSIDLPATGVYLSDTASASLEGDHIRTSEGLVQVDLPGGIANGGDATATNVTIEATGTAASVNESALTLNSSIVQGLVAASAAGTCSISFSRGDVQVPGGNGCQNFQTVANPMLTAPGDPHLQSGSPMVDAGDPAGPPAGTLDIDGEPRQLDGNGDGVARRDIGADERPTAIPPASGGGTTGGPPPPRKCGKKKRLKKGKCVKKKKKKRRN